ncbi:hypothetical protein DFJ58DRAFT_731922 [Suillus subalutaceus]|uniref:uncharacterized protein n=1 Tax=Suillus subalutaceus TaxID=48586 RepID=UPI001B87D476|nr:uncharacterized protein DFJ58DRAFT_731922 [Suillus subalutaceus]KAG1842763.1 hypothetical protein DFJ58DRAFT_731922 [Suillus subalutaceus]
MVLLHTQQTIKSFYSTFEVRCGLSFLVCSSLCLSVGKVAPAAVWAFDYCLTFEHEVRLFSSMGCRSIAHAMFIITRYVPIAWITSEIYVTLGPQSVETCLTTYRTAGGALVLIMTATEGLLLMRTLALWHHSKKIKRFLLASYLLVAISMLTCAVSPNFESVCAPTSTQSSVEEATRVEQLIMGMFVSAALFELTVVIATTYHSLTLRSAGIGTINKLVSKLWRGSLLYALSLFAISIANIVSFSLPVSSGQSGIIDVFQGVLHGVMASRILFDLRDADRSEEDNFQLTSYVPYSDLQFASHNIPMTALTALHNESNV